LKRGKRKEAQQRIETRINEQIRSRELRVIGASGDNLGVISLKEALQHAKDAGLDLVEIAGNAIPPVAKITDYGRHVYDQKKKARDAKANARTTETKSVQIKIGTGENDMMMKAKRAAEWLDEGHRVKVELFLKGRYKFMDEALLKKHLEKFLLIIPYAYRIADDIKKDPKGFAAVIERDGSAGKKPKTQQQSYENKQVIHEANKSNQEG
jgi:translation initiation factor IF-3